MNPRSAIPGTKEHARRLRERARPPQVTARLGQRFYAVVRRGAWKRKITVDLLVRRALASYLGLKRPRGFWDGEETCRSKTT